MQSRYELKKFFVKSQRFLKNLASTKINANVFTKKELKYISNNYINPTCEIELFYYNIIYQ